MENKKLSPLKFLPDTQAMPWGEVQYLLADLGFVDSMAVEGWLKGNTLSDIMQTYLERVVGETAFEWYGTQFPVLVKRLKVKGRTSLHINPDDVTAEQRYDAFGKTALWYVEAAGPDARLFLGFKRPVGADEFFRACESDSVEELLHAVKPKAGVHDWGSRERELHLEEAFDLINFERYVQARPASKDILASADQFTVGLIRLKEPLQSHTGLEETFLLYVGLSGEACIEAAGEKFSLKAGEVILVPAELSEFVLAPVGGEARVLEVRMDPRSTADPFILNEARDL